MEGLTLFMLKTPLRSEDGADACVHRGMVACGVPGWGTLWGARSWQAARLASQAFPKSRLQSSIWRNCWGLL